MPRYVTLGPGDPAPAFQQRTPANPRFVFDTAAGRYIVLFFLASAADPAVRAALAAMLARRDLFDDARASLFAVSLDREDETQGRLADTYPGYRVFWDFDGAASRLYGSVPADAPQEGGPVQARRLWVVLDPGLRVLRVVPFAGDGSDTTALLAYLEGLPPVGRHAGIEVQAPILYLPNVFEPELCRQLIAYYEAHGGEESGAMREVDGRTVRVDDPSHKRRKDCIIEDRALIAATRQRFLRKVVPQIHKAHQFQVTRMERYIVACYAAQDQGHFRPHRDNTTRGTAHRRFAASVNLNDDYDGGEIGFPEYGPRSFRPPVGGAVVFSCSLLHAVSRVTRGRRYAFLPFLYDEAAAKIREANNAFLGEEVEKYRAR